jgi:hypothetical protein
VAGRGKEQNATHLEQRWTSRSSDPNVVEKVGAESKVEKRRPQMEKMVEEKG